MNPLFADTSCFVAFLSDSDEAHGRAVDYLDRYQGSIVTTPWVLAELGNFLCKRKTRLLFVSFLRVYGDSAG